MRRVVIAPSFDREVEAIGLLPGKNGFGKRPDATSSPNSPNVCPDRLCSEYGNMRHGYDTKLVGFVINQSWIFVDFNDEEVRFLHIVVAKRDKSRISFDMSLDFPASSRQDENREVQSSEATILKGSWPETSRQ